jgi:hypothetical protein
MKVEFVDEDLKETKKYYVYMHTSPNGKKYIGMTRNFKQRWASGYKDNKKFHEDINKFGWDNIKHDILAETYYGWLARKLEKDMILRYKDVCYNETNFSKIPKFIRKRSMHKKTQDNANNNVIL